MDVRNGFLEQRRNSMKEIRGFFSQKEQYRKKHRGTHSILKSLGRYVNLGSPKQSGELANMSQLA
jgi:hypothetical protein